MTSNLTSDDLFYASFVLGYALVGIVVFAVMLWWEHKQEPRTPVATQSDIKLFILLLAIYITLWPFALTIYLAGAHHNPGGGNNHG